MLLPSDVCWVAEVLPGGWQGKPLHTGHKTQPLIQDFQGLGAVMPRARVAHTVSIAADASYHKLQHPERPVVQKVVAKDLVGVTCTGSNQASHNSEALFSPSSCQQQCQDVAGALPALQYKIILYDA